jgi:hypothetical protein
VIGAGLFLRSFRKLQSVESGFRPEKAPYDATHALVELCRRSAQGRVSGAHAPEGSSGIRLALGARPWQVVAWMMRPGIGCALGGIVFGLFAAAGLVGLAGDAVRYRAA